MKKIKTTFVPASFQKTSLLSTEKHLINGDQSSRDIQAAIDEMELKGYDFMHSENFISGSPTGFSYTEGTLLYFRKIENPS